MKKYVVAIRPDYEIATKYGAYWTNELYNKFAVEWGYTVLDLYGDDCIQDNLKYYADKYSPVLLAGVAHGNVDVIAGQYGRKNLLFIMGDEKTKEIVKGKHVWMLSCLAGKELLRWMVEECGAVSTMGYKDVFVFLASKFPNSYAEPFFRSHFAGVRALLSGKRVQDAFVEVINMFDKYLEDPNVDERVKPYIKHDRDVAVWYGNGAAVIEPPSEPIPNVRKATVRVYLKKLSEEKGLVIFEVVDEETGKGVKGAVVKMVGGDGTRFEGRTDESGKVEFEVSIQDWSWSVEASGYEGKDGIIKKEDFGEDKKVPVKVVIKRVGDSGSVTFYVFDYDSKRPIQGAKITMVGEDGTKREGYTDESGCKEFDNVKIQDWDFTVEKEGYQKVSGHIKKEDFI